MFHLSVGWDPFSEIGEIYFAVLAMLVVVESNGAPKTFVVPYHLCAEGVDTRSPFTIEACNQIDADESFKFMPRNLNVVAVLVAGESKTPNE